MPLSEDMKAEACCLFSSDFYAKVRMERRESFAEVRLSALLPVCVPASDFFPSFSSHMSGSFPVPFFVGCLTYFASTMVVLKEHGARSSTWKTGMQHLLLTQFNEEFVEYQLYWKSWEAQLHFMLQAIASGWAIAPSWHF